MGGGHVHCLVHEIVAEFFAEQESGANPVLVCEPSAYILAFEGPSLRFTTNQSCLAAQASSTESALFFNGITFRYTASGALTSPSTVNRAAN